MQAKYKYPKLWNTWRAMHERCYNINYKAYKNYGAKGIKICASWKKFDNFKEYAYANGYVDGYTIDRIDSNQDYKPENCRFIPASLNSTRANVARKGIKFKNLGKDKAGKIIKCLESTSMTFKEIASLYDTTISSVTDINMCHTYKSLHNYKYNIRKETSND